MGRSDQVTHGLEVTITVSTALPTPASFGVLRQGTVGRDAVVR